MFPIPLKRQRANLDYDEYDSDSDYEFSKHRSTRTCGANRQIILNEAGTCYYDSSDSDYSSNSDDEAKPIYQVSIGERKRIEEVLRTNTIHVMEGDIVSYYKTNREIRDVSLFDLLCSDIIKKLVEYIHYSSSISLLHMRLYSSTRVRHGLLDIMYRKHITINDLFISAAKEYAKRGDILNMVSVSTLIYSDYKNLYRMTLRKSIIRWGGDIIYVRIHNVVRYTSRQDKKSYIDNYPIDAILTRHQLEPYDIKWTRSNLKDPLKIFKDHHLDSRLPDNQYLNWTPVCKCQWLFGCYMGGGICNKKVRCAHCYGDFYTSLPEIDPHVMLTYLEVRDYHFGDYLVMMCRDDKKLLADMYMF
jgi:hypothetical protein